VYLGNLIGSVLYAALFYLADHPTGVRATAVRSPIF